MNVEFIMGLVRQYGMHFVDAANHESASRADIAKTAALKTLGEIRAALSHPPAAVEAGPVATVCWRVIEGEKHLCATLHIGANVKRGDLLYLSPPGATALRPYVEARVEAWLTEDGERVVTELTMSGARQDGGAILSSLKAYSIPLGRITVPDVSASAQAGTGPKP